MELERVGEISGHFMADVQGVVLSIVANVKVRVDNRAVDLEENL